MLRRGHELYSAKFILWFVFSFAAAAVVNYGRGIVGLSEADFVEGDGFLIYSLVCAATAYGLFRRHAMAWTGAVVLSVSFVGVSFIAISNEIVQMITAGVAIVNACILVWVKKDFLPEQISGA